MIKNRNIALDAAIDPSKIMGGGLLGAGEIFYVAQFGTGALAFLQARVNPNNLFVWSSANKDAIQEALDATVECRNDYVVVWPADSDYDNTSALTLSKKSVHLVAPSGLGNMRGATNAVRIEQTNVATTVFAVSDSSVEIAGFYVKPYIVVSHATLAATSYAPNIHHNTFVLKWTSSNEASIIGTGDAGAWGAIENNWFVSQSGDDKTCAAIVDIKSAATAARVNYNDFMIGDGNTATVGIKNAAVKGSCNYNTFAVAADDGAFTHCVSISTWGSAIGNRSSGSADGELVVGGVQHKSFSDNMNSVSGGVIDDAQ